MRQTYSGIQRRAVLVVIVGACVGALLIMGFERYGILLREWILAEPGSSAHRVMLVLLLLAALLFAPLLSFAAYVWWLGGRVLETQEYPPLGLRVIRDAPVTTGEKAVLRGRLLKLLAFGCAAAAIAMARLLWRLAS